MTHSTIKIGCVANHIKQGKNMKSTPSMIQILLEAYSEYREAYISSKYSRLESY